MQRHPGNQVRPSLPDGTALSGAPWNQATAIAVQAAQGEAIVFSWIEWPSKAVRDAAWGKIMSEDLMAGELAVDGRRMIHGGFAPIVDI